MCELLGMSANVPTDICFSFTGLAQRGGKTGPHSDGWGITFYKGKGCRSFRDSVSCYESRVADLVQQYPIKSCSVISHIRQANRGEVCLENTHPFTRELWGMNWTFAHNGQLDRHDDLETGFYLPIGETDSERAFCWFLHRIREQFPEQPEDPEALFRFIGTLCDRMRERGVFNMLLTNGEYMMAYCSNNLHWITRRAPFGEAHLIDAEVAVDFRKETTLNDVVSVIATRPLTDNEAWNKMETGEFRVFQYGELLI